MSTLDGNIGPKAFQQGGKIEGARFDSRGSLVVTEAHGRYTEASRRGKLYSIGTGFLGTTAAAAHLNPVAAAAATLLTLYNPKGSGVELSILRVCGDFISGTVEVGCYCFDFHPEAVITATPNAVAKCLRAGEAAGQGTTPAGKARGFTGTALTGGAAGVEGPTIGMWATAGTQRLEREINGAITVPQGCAVTIAAPTNGTSAVSAWTIEYEELDIV
jgi:hypothetical protein